METGKRGGSPISSKFNKKLRLGIPDEEIKEMNTLLQDWLTTNFQYIKEEVSTTDLALTFQQIFYALETPIIDKSWANVKKGEERIHGLPREQFLQLSSMWNEAVKKGDWESLANHSILQAEVPTVDAGHFPRHPRKDEATATEKCWERPFQGNAATGLRMHIETHHRVYPRFCAIVQSSGMGKSRTVDELAKDCFVIPLNLRDRTSAGYPPADHIVRDYLTILYSKNLAYDRICVFLEALFAQTASTLLKFEGQLDYVGFAKRFRSYMTEGQTVQGHNQNRENFYRRVVEKANQLLDGRNSTSVPNEDFPPCAAFKLLGQILGLPTSPSAKGKQKAGSQKNVRLVVLAFDEAHIITQQRQTAGKGWSVFNELHHALRWFHGLPLFSLFLTTTIRTVRGDHVIEVAERELVFIPPYSDLGFDPLAHVITTDGSWNLEQLTEDSQMFSLGRPLFAARYQDGSELVKQEIIRFAASKLLNEDCTTVSLSGHQLLACLSQRLPVDFNSRTYISREKEMSQVEAHLRICLNVGTRFETMTTSSSSEPILSEAAYFIMQRSSFNAPTALKSAMEGFSISKGDRGEFLALLLLILARDSAVGPPDDFGRPITGRRWFGLGDFLYGQLFRKQTSRSNLVDKKSLKALRKLSKDFPNAQLHFSHFVKAHESNAINLGSLLLLQARGAAVLCASNLAGVGAINVFLVDGPKLIRENAGLTLYQVWNDPMYSMKPEQKSFDVMDPYYLKILEEDDDAVPLIKIVFALAAHQPALHVTRRAPTDDYPSLIYEIWCAGISPDFLGPIQAEDLEIWDSLLEASYTWKDIYKTTSTVTAGLRKSASPGVARDVGHYSCWASR